MNSEHVFKYLLYRQSENKRKSRKEKKTALLKDTKNVFNLENNITYFYSGFNTFMNS